MQNLALGYLEYEKDSDVFLSMSFAAQLLGGIGAGAISTSSFSILSSFRRSEREKYIGWIEAVNGLGFLFGPIFGAFLYNLGGFNTPFFFYAAMIIVCYPFISYSLVSSCKTIDPYLLESA